MEDEYFQADFRIADQTISFAEEWNDFCDHGKEILVSRGDIKQSNSGICFILHMSSAFLDILETISNPVCIMTVSHLNNKIHD